MSENNPGRLRLWADNIEKNSKYGILPRAATNPTILRELAAAWEADRAALERARALLVELEWCGVDGWEQCPWCLGYKDSHPGMKHGHSKVCKLAAALGS